MCLQQCIGYLIRGGIRHGFSSPKMKVDIIGGEAGVCESQLPVFRVGQVKEHVEDGLISDCVLILATRELRVTSVTSTPDARFET